MQHKICNNSHNLEKRHLTLLRCPFILPLKVRAPAISEWTHSKVNPIDYPSFLQQQLVEVLGITRDRIMIQY